MRHLVFAGKKKGRGLAVPSLLNLLDLFEISRDFKCFKNCSNLYFYCLQCQYVIPFWNFHGI